MKAVRIIGGGFSGMTAAYYLAKLGHPVELYEASGRLGGMLSSERTPHGLVESAANAFIFTEDLAELLRDLKLDYLSPLEEFKKKRYIFRGKLRLWPLGVAESLALAVKFGLRWVFARKSLTPKPRESVWEWGLRNLGFAATKYLLSPGLQGIYAADARGLSAQLILGPLFGGRKPRSAYRGLISFSEGMQSFVTALESKLRQMGVRIHLNADYSIVDLAVPTIICVPANAVSEAVRGVSPEVAAGFSAVQMLPVISATVFYEKVGLKLEGFGCLFPEDKNFKALGVLSNTFIFSNRGPDYSETWILGGARSPNVLQLSDLEILHLIQTERRRVFPSSSSEFSEYRIHRWPKGLPYYTPELASQLDLLQLPKNLYLHGNYMAGIGLSKILTRSKDLAATIETGARFT